MKNYSTDYMYNNHCILIIIISSVSFCSQKNPKLSQCEIKNNNNKQTVMSTPLGVF